MPCHIHKPHHRRCELSLNKEACKHCRGEMRWKLWIEKWGRRKEMKSWKFNSRGRDEKKIQGREKFFLFTERKVFILYRLSRDSAAGFGMKKENFEISQFTVHTMSVAVGRLCGEKDGKCRPKLQVRCRCWAWIFSYTRPRWNILKLCISFSRQSTGGFVRMRKNLDRWRELRIENPSIETYPGYFVIISFHEHSSTILSMWEIGIEFILMLRDFQREVPSWLNIIHHCVTVQQMNNCHCPSCMIDTGTMLIVKKVD